MYFQTMISTRPRFETPTPIQDTINLSLETSRNEDFRLENCTTDSDQNPWNLISSFFFNHGFNAV